MSASETPARPARGTCADCGAEASSDRTFCEDCGAFLSWTAQPAPAGGRPANAPAAPSAEAEAPAASLVTATAPAAAGTTGATTSPAPAAAAPSATATGGPAVGAPEREAETTELPPVPVDAAARVPAPAPATERARALLVPVAEAPAAPPADPAVAPVLPGRPEEARPRVRGTAEEPEFDGATCPWCATSNPPERHFCRRCGAQFATRDEAGAAPLPWWRRLFGGDGGEAPWAGQRPRLRRGFGRTARLALLAGLVVLVLVAGLIWAGPAVDAVNDHFAKRVPIDPVAVTASRSYEGHGPELTIDKISNSWWGTGIEGDSAGEWLEAGFGRPVRLLDLVITPGASADAAQQLAQARPRQLELLITDVDGRTVTRQVELTGDGAQRVKLRAGRVTKVRLVLRSAFGVAAGKQVAVAEVEFFGRKTSGSS
ncbi:zinc ribbon domain-containing protein [Kitasatospora sp. NBC_00240]|uniref:NADase-type glycan-binding domain-containing protein n=1 Tax=Kitasatospora sp. NBC_00240 TaxID=2903567 RepID=UPI0022543FE1|nr:zinc ribbon domain-containing protein [Kitasatospora sp. NBC_00240]MCX5213560.1 zinc ribbon domain-containing protein [Kitasatospora sp. NBC_00240]